MGNNKEHKSFKERAKNLFKSKWGGYIFILFIFLLLICFFPEKNIFTLVAKRIEYRRQNNQIRELQENIIVTNEKIHELTDNPEALEQHGREEFHLCKPGEDVYLTDEKTNL